MRRRLSYRRKKYESDENLFIIFGVFCVLLHYECRKVPRIIDITEDANMRIGEKVELACELSNVENCLVSWSKINKSNRNYVLSISENENLLLNNNRYSLKFNGSSIVLTIQDFEESDEGLYICQVEISPKIKITAETQLTVNPIPFISFDSSKTINAIEGQHVQLDCLVGDSPITQISWRRGDNSLLPNGQRIYRGDTLKFLSVRKENRGDYYCVVDNSLGVSVRHHISLNVEFAPVIRERVGQALYHDANLTCEIQAYPQSDVTWSRNGIRIVQGERQRLTLEVIEDTTLVSILGLTRLVKEDFGVYTCRTTNKLGMAETQVELYETAKPA